MCFPDRGCSAAEAAFTTEGSDGDGDCGAATLAMGECGDVITFRRRIFLTDAGAPKLSSARDACRRIAAAASAAVIVNGRRNMICRKNEGEGAEKQIVGLADRRLLSSLFRNERRPNPGKKRGHTGMRFTPNTDQVTRLGWLLSAQ